MASVVVDRFRVTAVRTKAAACKTRSRTSEYQAHHVKYTDAFDRLRQSWIDELQQGAEAGRNANPTVGAAPGRWRAGLARYCRTKSFDLRPVISGGPGSVAVSPPVPPARVPPPPEPPHSERMEMIRGWEGSAEVFVALALATSRCAMRAFREAFPGHGAEGDRGVPDALGGPVLWGDDLDGEVAGEEGWRVGPSESLEGEVRQIADRSRVLADRVRAVLS